MNHPEDHHVDEQALQRGHEIHESNVRLIVKFGVALTGMTVFSMLLMWAMFEWIEGYNSSSFEKPAPLTEINQLPPEPRLQVLPEEDLAKMREAEQKKLSSYDWVIRTAEIVQIPVDRAMQLTIDDSRFSLPVRSAVSPNTSKATP
ncbi:MAG: hypothetical protein FJY97_06790 [candidate division Zixibacteria bacterium]|nr:hypothetical protein [candidate division Zixibacteria bacterium]